LYSFFSFILYVLDSGDYLVLYFNEMENQIHPKKRWL